LIVRRPLDYTRPVAAEMVRGRSLTACVERSMSWRLCVSLAIFAALTASLAPSAPAPRLHRPRIEIVFCLDTTGSMSGLLDGLRRSFWGICNQILSARPTPELKVGVVAFRDKGDEYVTRVFDLRDDLDAVYFDVANLDASGGGDTPEHVNQALDDAVHKVGWSTDKQTLKIIFLVGDAAPHTDYADDVKYPVTCKKALQKGLLINTIQCGTDTECGKHFKEIADKGGGAHVVIPQTGGVQTVPTPLDKRLGEINARLGHATVVFGPLDTRFRHSTRLGVALTLPVESAADRAGYLSKTGRVARYDLIDTIRVGRVKLDDVPRSELTADMEKMTASERRGHLDRLGRLRAELLVEAYELDRKRMAYLARHGEGDRFDAQVLELLRKQAGKRLRF
jgi:uncharacterized protein YegL